ncbi:M48 family metallopeptidase [uncultured Clostridium sp.]|uniref:tetratricopeptide repeat protein n=1 Tax=uncultured Clostridium sp. TaxID=59620 RepID=UPI0025ECB16E|nr:tetratricopeptide repeat protein [uncultured Clostridium sp.]MDU4884708.1 hypothetical protein [Clostridium celatum]MDU7077932.1 hypothetical protein [Clostridium celatum]
MKKNLNKGTIILLSIGLVSLLSGIFLGTQFAILILLILILIYLIVTKKHYIKVFKGTKSYKLEDYKKALEYYRDAAMSPWANAPIITNYLICELKYGKPSLAKEYINENLKIKNVKPHDFINLEVTKSIVIWKTTSKEEAITSLKKLLHNNKSTYIYETLTSFLLFSNKFDEAKDYINEAMEFNPDNNIIKSNYAEICYKLEKFDEAKKHFDTLINENVRFIEPYYYTALIENKNGNFEKSIELLRKAQELNESLVSLISQSDVEQALNCILVKSLNSI